MSRDPLPAAVGSVIRAERVRLGMSQEQLAERAGTHPTVVGGIERGARNPSILKLDGLLRALHLGWATFGTRVERALDDPRKSARTR